MSQTMSVGVVVPVYNRSGPVVEALESIITQSLAAARLVVVNDGSTDDTLAVLNHWRDQLQTNIHIDIITQDNQGVAAARNRGVAALGDDVQLLAFLDSDDLWPRDFLARCVAAFSKANHENVVACVADRLDLDCVSDDQQLRDHALLVDNPANHFFLINPPGTPTVMMQLDAFYAVGKFDEDLPCGEDYLLHLRLAAQGKWRHVPGEPVVCRRWTSGQRDHETQLSKRFDDRRYHVARALDRFYIEQSTSGPIPGAWRKRLGRLWYSAGRQLIRAGKHRDAKTCFKRAAEVYPWHVRAQWRAIVTGNK